jgi:hypothetical protein
MEKRQIKTVEENRVPTMKRKTRGQMKRGMKMYAMQTIMDPWVNELPVN